VSRLSFAVLVLVAAMCAPRVEAQAESVRIAVGRFPDAVTIAGAGLTASPSDGPIDTSSGKLTLAASKGGIRVGGVTLKSDVVRIKAPGPLSLLKHRYHRELEVRFRFYDKKPELLIVHPLDLETYVAGIVSAELPGGWPLEAYKAQAVAARTFAVWQKYRRLDLPYHMESSVLDQVYAGVDREHPLALQAAKETRGLVLTSKRQVAQSYFHAACGDRTESALEGWGTALSYLPGSKCGKCTAAARHAWTARLTRAEVDKPFRALLAGESVESLTITAKTKTGRAKSVLVKGKSKSKTITGPDLRRLLGYSTVWSTWIDVLSLDSARGAWTISGKGTGHGVGMCQWGARGFALAGKRYDDILAVYYPGAPLMRLY
jgi:stage II sporulation protein D